MTASPKISVYMAISLDGFIARSDGRIDWLEHDSGGEDYGYNEFIASVDTLVMGRKTFETVLSFGGAWPHQVPTVVLSRRQGPELVPPALADVVRVTDASPATLVKELAAAGNEHVYVDGGLTIQAFLRAGLVDELTLSFMPVLIGSGLPLFGPLDADVHLRQLDARAYPSGLVQTRYAVRSGDGERDPPASS